MSFALISLEYNFNYFRVQTGLKCMLEYFASINGHLRKSFVEKWRWNIFTKYKYHYYLKKS